VPPGTADHYVKSDYFDFPMSDSFTVILVKNIGLPSPAKPSQEAPDAKNKPLTPISGSELLEEAHRAKIMAFDSHKLLTKHIAESHPKRYFYR